MKKLIQATILTALTGITVLLLSFKSSPIITDDISEIITDDSTKVKDLGPEVQVMDYCEVEPQFPGGQDAMMQYVQDNIQIEISEENQGIVYVKFIVQDNGNISNIGIQRGENQILKQEAIRIVQSMPKWIPGSQNGKNQHINYILPFKFRYNNEPLDDGIVFAITDVEEEEIQEEEEIFNFVEVEPQFVGGPVALHDFIQENLDIYSIPEKERENGNVYIQFVVRKDGTLSDIKVIKGVNNDMNQEAIRIIKMMPDWNPGKQAGQVVNCRFTVPVHFRF